jgi:ABC-type bacteriocin/lantibiotic exporter with double-glycine peptidase domain
MKFRWPTFPNKAKKTEDKEKQEDTVFMHTNQTFSRFQLNLSSLSIKKGTLTFFIGGVGSGKSAIFNALLNEMDFIDLEIPKSVRISIDSQASFFGDKAHINGTVAYVPSNSWLQNSSIRVTSDINFSPPFFKRKICKKFRKTFFLENQ